jgi:hypothetical protein
LDDYEAKVESKHDWRPQKEKLKQAREDLEESLGNVSVLSVSQMNSEELEEFMMEIFINLKTSTNGEIDEVTADNLRISIEDFWDMNLPGSVSLTIIKVEDFNEGTKIIFELRIQDIEINSVKKNRRV